MKLDGHVTFTNVFIAVSGLMHFLQSTEKKMAPTAIPTRECYIDGQFVAPNSIKRLPVICPFTEEQIGTIPAGGAHEICAAVSAANTAFYKGPWSKLTGAERASYLRKIADKVRRSPSSLSGCSAPDDRDDSTF